MIKSEGFIKHRLECFKISYEINSKIGNIKNSYENEQQLWEDLKDVFKLSDMIIEYTLDGEHPYEE